MRINTNRWNKIRYTLWAPIFDIIGSLLNSMRRRSLHELGIQKGDKVLIVGCGTGLDLKFIDVDCAITATDITPSMVERTLRRSQQLHRNVGALVMDAQQLTFPAETFDKVVLHFIVAVVPNPIDTITEAERVLKTGGSMVMLDKFVRKGHRLSLLRRIVNIPTNILFSDITRSAEEIVSHTHLRVLEDIKAEPTGNVRILKLAK